MATPPDPRLERARREAIDWLILLQDEPDDAVLRARFEAWRLASPVHEDAWEHTRKTMGIVAQFSDANTGNWRSYIGAAGASAKSSVLHQKSGHGAADRVPASRQRFRRGLAVSVAVAASVALWIALPDLFLRFRADALTGTAEKLTLSLPDGGSVTLAPGSALAWGKGGDRRHVTLLAGEALFSVTHDEQHPFTVRSGAFRVTDIGTVFDVRREGNGMAVAVRSGRVRADGHGLPAGGADLGAGQALTVSPAGFHTEARTPEQIGAWAEGFLVANDQPLGVVVDRLRPWLRGKVIISARLAQQPVSGVYNLADPSAALDAIAHARRATVRHLGPWITVIY